MADDGYLIGFEDSSGNFVEVGRFNNLSGNTSDPVFIEHTGSGTRMELDGSGFDMNGGDITNAGSVSTDEQAISEQFAKVYATSKQSIPSGPVTDVVYDTAASNNNPGGVLTVDLTNNHITIDKAGQYLIICRNGFTSATDQTRYLLRISVDGITVDAHEQPGSGANRNNLLCVTTVGVSNPPVNVSASVFQGSGSSQDANGNKAASHLEVTRLG